MRGRSWRLRINYRTSAEILQLVDGHPRRHRHRRSRRGPRLAQRLPVGAARRTSRARPCRERGPGSRRARDGASRSGRRRAWTRATSLSSPVRSVVLRSLAKELGVHGIRSAELRETEPPYDAVRLSTMHGMKGLEFRCVAIVGVGQAELPAPPRRHADGGGPGPARPRRAAGALSAVRGVYAGTRAAPGLVVRRRQRAGTARTHAGVGAYPKSTNLLRATSRSSSLNTAAKRSSRTSASTERSRRCRLPQRDEAVADRGSCQQLPDRAEGAVLRHHDPEVTGVVAQLALAALHHAQHRAVEVIGRVGVRL